MIERVQSFLLNQKATNSEISLWKVSLLFSFILGISLIIVPAKIFLAIFGGVVIFLLFFIRFEIAIFLYVVIVPLTIHLPPSIHHAVSYSMSGMLIFSYLIKKLVLGEKFFSLNTSFVLFISAYTVWGIICSLYSDYVSEGLFFTFRQFAFFAIFYIFFDWMRSRKEINLIINSMIVMGALASIPVIYQVLSFGITKVFLFDTPIRFGGFYSGVNALGMHLAFILPMAISKFIYIDLPKRNFRTLFFIFIICFALFFTFSRSAWLMAVVAISIIFFHQKKLRLVFLTALFLFVLLLLFSPEFSEVILRLKQGISQRDILWRGAISIIKDYPLFGTGPGTFRYYIASYAPLVPWRWPVVNFGGIVGGDSHNLFLTRGAEMGIIGMFLILYLFISYFRVYSSARAKAKIFDLEYALLGAVAIVVGALARSFFEGKGIISGGGISFDLFFWIMVAFTLRLAQGLVEKKQ